MPNPEQRKKPLTNPLGERFNEALVYAHTLHRHQPRKGKDVPYIGHLLGVTSLVLENGGDEEMAIAALLHDAVEDQGGLPRLHEIEARFGKRVAHIVEGCTDSDVVDADKKLPWCERKQWYVQHVERDADAEVRFVSAADKVHNARAILNDHHESGDRAFEHFSKKKQGTLWYYRALVNAYRAAETRDGNHDPLAQARRRLIAEPDR